MLKDEGSTSRTLMSGPSIVFQTPANSDGTNVWATSRLLGSPAAAGSARGTFSIQVRDQYDPFNNGTSWNWRTCLTAINTGNIGIGTTSPTSKLTISSSVGGDSSWNDSGILIENTSTTTGEPTLAFRNAGTAGTGSSYWFTGLNQSNLYKIAFGTSFTDSNTKLELATNGALKLNFYTQGFLQTDANGNVSTSGGGTLPGGPYLPLSAGSSYPLTGDLYVNAKITFDGDTENQIYRSTTSLIKGTTTDTTIVKGRTVDIYAFDDVNIRAGSNDNISFTAGGVANAMYINSAGNVGIGTTSPDTKLHVIY
jgi:hypothetical protein